MEVLISGWTSSMGMVALKRFDKEDDIRVSANTIDIPTTFFDTFAENFFDVLHEDYKGSSILLNRCLTNIDYFLKAKVAGKGWKERLRGPFVKKAATDEVIKSIEGGKAYIDDFFTAIDVLIASKKESIAAQELAAEVLRNKLITYFTTPEIEALYDNYHIRYTVFNRETFGQGSFLNSTNTDVTIEKAKQLFTKDFLDEIRFEWHLHELIAAKDERTFKQLFTKHLQDVKEKRYTEKFGIVNAYKKAHRKEKYIEVEEGTIDWTWFEDFEECALVPNTWATIPYSESLCMPFGMNALNMRWDMDAKNSDYVSAFSKLLFFILPFGCARYANTFHSKDSEYLNAFFHIEGDCVRTLRENIHFRKSLEGGNTLEGSIQESLALVKHKGTRRNDTHFIEFCSYGTQAKKTVLHYTILKPYILELLTNTGTVSVKWENIHPQNLRNTIISKILSGDTILPLFQQLLYEQLKNEPFMRDMRTCIEVLRIIDYLSRRGGKNVSRFELTSYQFLREGQDLRKALIQNQGLGRVENAIYSVMHLIKAKNRSEFINRAIRFYKNASRPLYPALGLLTDKKEVSDEDFGNYAYAFLVGLLSLPYKERAEYLEQEQREQDTTLVEEPNDTAPVEEPNDSTAKKTLAPKGKKAAKDVNDSTQLTLDDMV